MSATAPSISTISEPNILHQAMKTIHHAVIAGLGNGKLVLEMPMHDPLILRILMTEEHCSDPKLKEVLDAPHFTFFWAFAGAWATFRKTPNTNPEEFLSQQKDSACRHGFPMSSPQQKPPVTTTYTSRTAAVDKIQPKVIDSQKEGLGTAEHNQKPTQCSDRAEGTQRKLEHPKAHSTTPQPPNVQQTLPKPTPATTKSTEPHSQNVPAEQRARQLPAEVQPKGKERESRPAPKIGPNTQPNILPEEGTTSARLPAAGAKPAKPVAAKQPAVSRTPAPTTRLPSQIRAEMLQQSTSHALPPRIEQYQKFEDVNDDSDEYTPPDPKTQPPKRKRKSDGVQAVKKSKVSPSTPADQDEEEINMDVVSDDDDPAEPNGETNGHPAEPNCPPNGKPANPKPDSKKSCEDPIATHYVFVQSCMKCTFSNSVCCEQYKPGRGGGACYRCCHRRIKCEGRSEETVLQDVSETEEVKGDIKEMSKKAEDAIKAKKKAEAKKAEEAKKADAKPRPRPVKKKKDSNELEVSEVGKIAEDGPSHSKLPKTAGHVVPVDALPETMPHPAVQTPIPSTAQPSSTPTGVPGIVAAAERTVLDAMAGVTSIKADTQMAAPKTQVAETSTHQEAADVLATQIASRTWKYIEERVDAKLEEFSVLLCDIRLALHNVNPSFPPPDITLTPPTPIPSQGGLADGTNDDMEVDGNFVPSETPLPHAPLILLHTCLKQIPTSAVNLTCTAAIVASHLTPTAEHSVPQLTPRRDNILQPHGLAAISSVAPTQTTSAAHCDVGFPTLNTSAAARVEPPSTAVSSTTNIPVPSSTSAAQGMTALPPSADNSLPPSADNTVPPPADTTLPIPALRCGCSASTSSSTMPVKPTHSRSTSQQLAPGKARKGSCSVSPANPGGLQPITEDGDVTMG